MVNKRLRHATFQRVTMKRAIRSDRQARLAIRTLLCALAAAIFQSTPVRADLMQIDATVAFRFLALGRPEVHLTATGVADVNQGGADFALNTLHVAGGISASVGVPVTDPEVTASVASIRWNVTLGTGSLAPFDATSPLTRSTLPLRGSVRLCLIQATCSVLLMPFTQSSGAVGIGVGGTFVPSLGSNAVAISIQAAPWTVGPAAIPVPTAGGGSISIPSSGFAHGPFSFSGSAALTGGELKLVSPVVVRAAEGLHPLTGFSTINIRFVPEPGGGLLVVAGIAGLATLGRGRITT
jgi:hypothetical protein